MKNKLSLVVVALTLFTGCASKGIWYPVDKMIMDEQADIELKKDDGYCNSVSYGAIPMPTQYIQSESSYNHQGTYQGYDYKTGSYYSGTYNGTSTPNYTGSFTTGFANGAAIGANMRANADRLSVWKSCMYKLGWVQEEDLKVRREDIIAWNYQPKSKLDTHPIFETLDKIEYIDDEKKLFVAYGNKDVLKNCTNDTNKLVDYNEFNRVTKCVSDYPSCISIFTIEYNFITSLKLIGSKCFTARSLQPWNDTKR